MEKPMTGRYRDRMQLRLFLHRRLVAPLAYPFSSRRLRQVIVEEIGDSSSVLDVSCGDDDLILHLSRPGRMCVANDLELARIKELQRKARGKPVHVTCGDARTITFLKQYDVAVCKNTLHHLRDHADILRCLTHLGALADRLIIVDVENPDGNLLSKLWNLYYRHFLGDDGTCFLTGPEFQALVRAAFPGARIAFQHLDTIKGRYLVAVVDVRGLEQKGGDCHG